jgi:hypothetical protein
MGSRLYVGNVSYYTTEDQLKELFGTDGRQVTSARIVIDRDTGRSRGFAFVDMATDEEAKAAMAALDGQEFDGRKLTVTEAREKTPGGGGGRSFAGGGGAGPRSFGGGDRGGGGFSGGGGRGGYGGGGGNGGGGYGGPGGGGGGFGGGGGRGGYGGGGGGFGGPGGGGGFGGGGGGFGGPGGGGGEEPSRGRRERGDRRNRDDDDDQ